MSGEVVGGVGFFWFPRETDKSVLIKLRGKKKKRDFCSFNGIPITCRLEMEFFFTQSEIITVSCVRNAIESKTALSRGTCMTCRASGNFTVVCLSFILEMKSNKDTLGTNKQIVDLIIY